jgi:hypothetical protein
LRDLTQHLTTRADDSRAAPVTRFPIRGMRKLIWRGTEYAARIYSRMHKVKIDYDKLKEEYEKYMNKYTKLVGINAFAYSLQELFIQELELIEKANALDIIARSAQGSMRDALTLLDQAIVYANGAVDTASVTAWLSSARVVRCWVKSRNERNPCP